MLAKVGEQLKTLDLGKKVVLTINYPGLLEDKRLTGEPWWNHFYQRYYFGVRDREDGLVAIREMKEEISEAETEKVYKLSGGLAQIMKFLAVNGSEARDGLEAVAEPIVKAILTTGSEIRRYLGLEIKGSVLEEYLRGKEWPIEIDFELNLIEAGRKGDKLTPVEAQILKKMMENQGKISKEEVAEIKWGEGKYDEFSDQAINKALRRISSKLKSHKIETIPKIGFVLRKNE